MIPYPNTNKLFLALSQISSLSGLFVRLVDSNGQTIHSTEGECQRALHFSKHTFCIHESVSIVRERPYKLASTKDGISQLQFAIKVSSDVSYDVVFGHFVFNEATFVDGSEVVQVTQEQNKLHAFRPFDIWDNSRLDNLVNHVNSLVYPLLDFEPKGGDKALKHSQTITFNSASDGLVAVDTHCRVTRLNTIGQEMTGQSFDKAKGEHLERLFNIVDHSARTTLFKHLCDVIATSECHISSDVILLKSEDGTEYYITYSIYIIDESNGIMPGAVLYFRNVSEDYSGRKEISRALTQAQSALRIANAQSFHIDFEDSERVVLNEQVPFLLDVHNPNNFVDWGEAIIKYNPHSGHKIIHDALAAVNNPDILSCEFDYRLPSEDGSMHWFRTHCEGERFLDGSLKYLSGITQDITEHKENLLEVELSNKRASNALSLANAYTWIMYAEDFDRIYFDPETFDKFTVSDANEGDSVETHVWMKEISAYDSAMVDEIERKFSKLINGASQQENVTFAKQDVNTGEVRWFYTVMSATYSENNQVISINGISQDITKMQSLINDLKQEKQYSDNVIALIPGTLYIFNREEGYQYISENFVKTTGYEYDYLKSLDIPAYLELIHPDDRHLFRDHVKCVFNSEPGVKSTISYRLRHRVGYFIWIEEMDIPFQIDTDGEVKAILGVCFDITERKVANQENERVSFLSDNALLLSKSGFWYYDFDEPDYYYPSDKLKDILGETNDEKTRCHLENDWLTQAHAADAQMALETKKLFDATLNGDQNLDVTYKYKRSDNGDVLWIRSKAEVVKDSTGKRRYVYGVMQDITEQKDQELALRRYKQGIESSSDAIGMFDFLSSETYVNQSFRDIFGYLDDDSIDYDLHKLCENTLVADDIINANKKGNTWLGEVNMLKKNGDVIPVNIRADVMVDDNGEVLGLIVAHTDVSERKIQMEKIAQLNNLLEVAQSVAKVGHFEFFPSKGELTCSTEFLNIFECSQSELSDYESFISRVYAADRESVSMSIQETIDKLQQSYRLEFRLETPNGIKYVLLKGHISLSDKKEVTYAFGTIQDITTSTLKNAELHDTQIRLIQAMRVGKFGTFNRDFINDIVECDTQLYELLGIDINVENNMKQFMKYLESDASEALQVHNALNKIGDNEYMKREFQYNHPIKGKMWVDINTVFFRDSSGAIENGVGIIRDITEKKNADLELLHQKDLSQILTEISTQYVNIDVNNFRGALEGALGEVGSFLDADRAYVVDYNLRNNLTENLFEWSSNALDGNHRPLDYFPSHLLAAISDCYHKKEMLVVSDVKQINEHDLFDFFEKTDIKSTCIVPMHLDDDTISFFCFEMWTHYHEFKDWEISLFNVFAEILSNIDQRMKTEKEKQRQHNFLKTLVSSIPDNVFAKDTQGIYTLANTSVLDKTGIKERDIIGKSDYEVYEKTTADSFREIDRQVYEAGKLISTEEIFTKPDGTKVFYDISKSPLRDDSGNVTGLLGIGRDVTAHKMHEQLILKNRNTLACQMKISEQPIDDESEFMSFCQDLIMDLTQSKYVFIYTYNQESSSLELKTYPSRVYNNDKTNLGLDILNCKIVCLLPRLLLGETFINNDFSTETCCEKGTHSSVRNYMFTPLIVDGKLEALVAVLDKSENYVQDDSSNLSVMLHTVWKKIVNFNYEEEQRKMQHYISELIHNIPMGILLIDNEEAKFVLSNEAARDMLEIDFDKAKPNELWSLLEKDFNGQSLLLNENTEYRGEHQIITPSSGINKWFTVTAHISNYFQREGLTLMCFYDISENKKLQLKISEAYEQIETATVAANIGMWDWYPQKNKIYFNETFETMLGYSKGDFLGKSSSWTSRIHPDDKEQVFKHINRFLIHPRDEKYDIEYRMQHKEGHYIWIRDVGHVSERDLSGKCVRFNGFHIDINTHKDLQINLEMARRKADEANRAKSAFLANMSHEIRTPMNAIIGFSSILSKMIDDPMQERYVESIVKSGKNLLGLINDILDISKIEAGKFELRKDAISLVHLTKDVEMIFALKMEDENIRFDINIHPDLPEYIEIDELRLRQVILNLISNALKFTDEGCITLKVDVLQLHADTVDVRIAVKDTGIGINDENKQKIFEAFHQVEEQDSRKYGGTGLGLSISTKIVHLLGGEISLESEVGKGSHFFIDLFGLKILYKDKDELETSLEVPLLAIEFEPAKILIVDDVEHNIEVAKGFLSEYENLEIYEASNGLDATKLYQKVKPDVVLMDLRMPNMDGYATTERILSLASEGDVNIIALTASAFLDSEKEVKRSGFSGYLRKPYEQSDLIKELVKVLPYQTIEEDTITDESIYIINANKELDKFKELEKLKVLLDGTWTQIRQKQSMRLLKSFVQDLVSLNCSLNVEALSEYIVNLDNAQKGFNIAASNKLISQFPVLVSSIQNANS